MLGREGPVLRVQGVVIKSVGGQQENQAAQQDPPDPQAEAVAPLGVRGRRTSNNRWGRSVCAHGLRSELIDRKSTRLNSSHLVISYAVFCLKKKKSSYMSPRSIFSLKISYTRNPHLV